MAEDFSVTISTHDLEKTIDQLQSSLQDKVIMRGMKKGGDFIRKWIQDNRLSGPRSNNILGVIKDRLRSSIAVTNPIKSDNGYELKIGTKVKYAPIHEFGGVIKRYPRSEIFLRNRRTKNTSKGNKGSFQKGFKMGRGFGFRAYEIHMPARPFLRPGIEEPDNQRKVLDFITEEINNQIKKNKK
jgi:phage gpG-like protein